MYELVEVFLRIISNLFRNTKHVLKHKVAIKREAAVTKDMNKEVICFELIPTSLQKLP